MSTPTDATIPDKCPGCSATTQTDVWWCPQCYLDFRPALPTQRESDSPIAELDQRGVLRRSRASALDVALAAEQSAKARHVRPVDTETAANEEAESVNRLASDMIAELAAADPNAPLPRLAGPGQKIAIGAAATFVMLLIVMGMMTLFGLLMN